jgi:protein-S-isoprenylcysteine O-methyltransferase Ste14
MLLADVLRLSLLAIWSLSIVGFGASVLRFIRTTREAVERQRGPLPTPLTFLNVIAVVILLLRIGEITVDESIGWLVVRGLGIGLSLYGLVILPWTMRTLGRFGIPGAAVLEDHALITSGPFQLVRHPGYSAFIALWLGTALATLNWLLLALWPLVVTGAFLASRAEEALLRDEFGKEYTEYAQQKSRFLPRVW